MEGFFLLALVCAVMCMVQARSYRRDYFVHSAVCLDYTWFRTGRVHPRMALYAYDLTEYGARIHREVWTDAYGPLTRGQAYKILVHKTRHEVIGTYSDRNVTWGFGICTGLYVVWRLLVRCGIFERLEQWI